MSDTAARVAFVAAPGVVLYKVMPYRGAPEEWGNTYHFVGDAPSDPAGWRDLVDDLIALETPIINSICNIERAICYENTDDASVYSYDLSAFGGVVAGGFDAAGLGWHNQEGGTSYMERWNTGRRSSSGKDIYLRKYWHPAVAANATPDVLAADMVTRLNTFGAAVMAASGSWPGLAGPDGVAPIANHALTYTNYRDLRKGRRRPT
jgi:hypothetical protein